MKRRFDIETEDLPNSRRLKNYKVIHNQQPQTNLLKQAQYISNVEVKNYDQYVDGLAVSMTETWSTGLVLFRPVEGTSALNRIGRKTTMTKIQFRYYFGDNVSGNGVCKFRILIVYDKQFNTVIPAIGDVLQQHISAPDPCWFNNLDNSDRFITIADVITDPLSFYDVPYGLISRNVNLTTIFNGGVDDGSGSSINSGALLLYFCSCLRPLVSTNYLYYNSRVRFLDA